MLSLIHKTHKKQVVLYTFFYYHWFCEIKCEIQCICTTLFTKNVLFQLDLRDIGEKWLPTDLSTGRVKVDYVSTDDDDDDLFNEVLI